MQLLSLARLKHTLRRYRSSQEQSTSRVQLTSPSLISLLLRLGTEKSRHGNLHELENGLRPGTSERVSRAHPLLLGGVDERRRRCGENSQWHALTAALPARVL